MSDKAWSVSHNIERLSRHDPRLYEINLTSDHRTDAELGELADCLLAHPDVVTHVYLANNELTDETGVKLARYLAASSTIERLDLSYNQLGSATYLALAAALRINSSLRYLRLHGNQAADRTRIDKMFMFAVWLNPDRYAGSVWQLYSYSDEFKRLQDAASELAHPSLQLLLAVLC